MVKIKIKILIILIISIIILTGVACSMNQSSKIPKLPEEQALSLVKEAAKLFEYLSYGGDNHEYVQNDFSRRRITDEKINSKERIIKLLEEIYSEQAAIDMYRRLNFKEENGHLYQPNADFVFTKTWREAVIKKISYKYGKATVIIEVPYRVGNSPPELDIIEAEFVFNENEEWKLNTPTH